jgi:hypothetical protein
VCNKTGVQISDELLADMKVASSYRMGQTVARALAEDPANPERNWRGLSERVTARTCVVAGVLGDGEKDCLERVKQLRKGNPESMAFKVAGKDMPGICKIQNSSLEASKPGWSVKNFQKSSSVFGK